MIGFRRWIFWISALFLFGGCHLYFDVDSAQLPDPADADSGQDVGEQEDVDDASGEDVEDASEDADTSLEDADSCVRESDRELCQAYMSTSCVEVIHVVDGCGDAREVECGPDLMTSFQHCGSCNNHCGPGEICKEGGCVIASCEVDPGGVEGACKPFVADDCDAESEICTLQAVVAGSPPVLEAFVTTCEKKVELGDLGPGESCTMPRDCAEGLFCVGWDNPDPRENVCARLCYRHDHRGCEADEFCTSPFFGHSVDEPKLEGLGFCTKRCSPLDPDSCGAAQRCTADPSHPHASCGAHFRCLNNGGFSGKSEGDSCRRSRLHEDGCPAGMACSPSSEGDRCVRVCGHDDECDSGACITADAPWQMMRYCALD